MKLGTGKRTRIVCPECKGYGVLMQEPGAVEGYTKKFRIRIEELESDE